MTSFPKPLRLASMAGPAFDRTHAWLVRYGALLLGSAFLIGLYTTRYLAYPALPGNSEFPAGWWGWADQSQYIASTLALSQFDLAMNKHFYPLGYALIGAPFARLLPMHPFFLVNLASLLITLHAFVRVAARCDLKAPWAVLIFVLASAADPVLFTQWVVPWTTTPLAMLTWLLLATAVAHVDGERRPWLLGFLSGCIPMLRPVDLYLVVPSLVACVVVDLRCRRLALRDVAMFGGGVLLPVCGYVALHVAIYGPHLSPYMLASGSIGFAFGNFGWKAYVLLVDPRAWFGGGMGLLRRCPWMILGLAGMLPAMLNWKTALLAVTLVLHSVCYIAYVDLLPTGLWRFFNVHYWTWAFPGFALLGALMLRAWRPSVATGLRDAILRRRAAAAGIVTVAFLLCIRFDPVPAKPGQSIDALDFPIVPTGFEPVYFGKLEVIDAAGSMLNISGVHSLPFPNSIRVLAMKRPFQEPIRVEGLGLERVDPVRLHARLGFNIPFRPWRRGDAFYGPRVSILDRRFRGAVTDTCG